MKRQFGILLLFKVIFVCYCQSDYYGDDHYDNDYYGDEPETPYNASDYAFVNSSQETGSGKQEEHDASCIESQLKNVLNENEKALIDLFGSLERAQQEVINPILNQKRTYWILDQALLSIETELDRLDKPLDPTTDSGIKNVTWVLDEAMNQYCQICMLCNLNDQTQETIVCALGRHARNEHFHKIETSHEFISEDWECETAIPGLWMDLISVDFLNKNCNLEQALSSVMNIVHEAEHYKKASPVNATEQDYAIQLDLLNTMSTPDAVQFLKPILCFNLSLESCKVYQLILCDTLHYYTVRDILEKVKLEASIHPPQTTKEIQVLLDIQRGLGHTSNSLTTITSVRTSSYENEAAKDMLNYYFDIVDAAFGDNSVDTWKQETMKTNAIAQFEQTLLESEDFAGFASDMLAARGEWNTEIFKNTVDVKMTRSSSFANFTFDNSKIWTPDFQLSNSSNEKFNVLAIYYKNWLEVLESIDNDLLNLKQTNSSTENEITNKTFVGKGGIISLSWRTNQEKVSVPVFYTIEFDHEKILADIGDTNGWRCLSCGYLNDSTISWESEGCYVTSVDDIGMTCHCNHTTNFAAFMSPYEPEFVLTDTEKLILNIFEYVGSVLSSICLILAFIVFCIVRHQIKHDRLRAHMNLALALLFVHLIQLFSEMAVQNSTACEITTVLTHYFLLATFMWMLIEGIFLYIYVIQVFMLSKIESRQWMYIIGWVLPMVIVAIAAGYGLSHEVYIRGQNTHQECGEGEFLYFHSNFSTNDLKYSSCWLSTSSGMIYSFIVPAIIVILINVGILVKVILVLVKLSARSKKMKSFKSSNHCYPNQGYGAKHKQSVTALNSKLMSPPIQSEGTSLSDETSVTHDSLHGMVLTHTSSTPSSCSKTSYSQNRSRSSIFEGSSATDNEFLKDVTTAVKGALVLLPLLGIPWIFGTLGYKSFVLQIMFVIINSSQGVAIFLIYCCFNEEVSRALRRNWKTYRLTHHTGYRSRASSSSSLKSLRTRSNRRSTEVLTVSRSDVI